MKKLILSLIILSLIDSSLHATLTLEKLQSRFNACEGKKKGDICGDLRGEVMLCYESNGKGSDLICLEKF